MDSYGEGCCEGRGDSHQVLNTWYRTFSDSQTKQGPLWEKSLETLLCQAVTP